MTRPELIEELKELTLDANKIAAKIYRERAQPPEGVELQLLQARATICLALATAMGPPG